MDSSLRQSTIEKTVKENNVASGESDWTFGQMLAIIVVLFPLIDLLPHWKLHETMSGAQAGSNVPERYPLSTMPAETA